jgi:hypothetical protein
MLKYFDNNNNKPLLCYVAKHFFCILPNLVILRRTTSQTGALATG